MKIKLPMQMISSYGKIKVKKSANNLCIKFFKKSKIANTLRDFQPGEIKVLKEQILPPKRQHTHT